MYRNITGGVQIILWTILSVVSGIAIKKLIKWRKSEKYTKTFEYCEMDEDCVFCVSTITAICILVLSISMVIGNIFGIIQNICMPELTVIQYIKDSMN